MDRYEYNVKEDGSRRRAGCLILALGSVIMWSLLILIALVLSGCHPGTQAAQVSYYVAETVESGVSSDAIYCRAGGDNRRPVACDGAPL